MIGKSIFRAQPGTMVVVGLLVLALVIAPGDARVVVAPMTATVLTTWLFFAALKRRGDSAPVADVGAWYVALVTLYAIIPLLIYLALGMRYTPLNDNRALQLQPPPPEMGRVAWMYAVHLAAFCIANIATHGKRLPPLTPRTIRVPSGILGISFVGLVLIWAVAGIVGGGGPVASSYSEGYALAAALPLGVRQVLKVILGMERVLTLVVFVALFQKYDRYKWFIWAFVVFRAAATFRAVGSRTDIAVLIVICFVLYHVTVRPISRRVAVTVGSVGVMGFMALGILRSFQGLTSGNFVFGANGGEFEAIFTNAVDLDIHAQAHELGPIPLSMSISDLVAPIPSQLLPFEKGDLAVWYLNRFYPDVAEAGGGFAFGIVPQSIIGFGWADLIGRGLLIGFVFGRLYKWYQRHRDRFWVSVSYIWILLWSYQTFRYSSFAVIVFVVQWLLPTIVIVEVVRRFLVVGFHRRAPTRPAISPILARSR